MSTYGYRFGAWVLTLACCSWALPAVATTPFTDESIILGSHLVPARLLSANGYLHYGGGVVHFPAGAFFLPAGDVSLPCGAAAYTFALTHSSIAAAPGPFGWGWETSLDVSLREEGENLLLTEAGRAPIILRPLEKRRYVSPEGGSRILIREADGTFLLDQEGSVRRFGRDGRLAQIRDGSLVLDIVNKGGRLVAVQSAGRDLVRLEYNAEGFVAALALPGGSTIRYAYDSSGNLVRAENAAGAVTEYGYDEGHRLVKVQAVGGPLMRIAYDVAGRVVSQTGPGERMTRYLYTRNTSGSRVEVVDVLGRRMVFDFSADRRVSISDFAGGTTLKSYDARGNLLEVRDPAGRVSRFSWDDLGRLASQGLPNGESLRFVYDGPSGRLASVSDGKRRAAAAYTDAGLLARFEDEFGRVTRFEYGSRGVLLARLGPGDRVTRYTYDDGGLLSTVTDSVGGRSSFEHDAAGRVTRILDARGSSSTRSYDEAGRPVAWSDDQNRTESITYDVLGRMTSLRDAAGRLRKIEYNEASQVARVRLGTPERLWEYRHDAAGRVTEATGPGGQRESYAYDPLDRIVRRTDGVGRTFGYAYDAAGRLEHVEAPDQPAIFYRYDKQGRLEEEGPQQTPRRYGYDLQGRLAWASAFGQTLDYRYDDQNRLLASTDRATGRGTEYSYDRQGRLVGQVDPHRGADLLSYDDQGRLGAFVDAGGTGQKFTYDKAGRPASVRFTSGEQIRLAYDPLGRLVESESTVYGLARTRYDSAGNVVSILGGRAGELRFDYDQNLSNLTGASSGNQSATYEYDSGDRLAAVLDGLGHRTRFEHDPADRVTGVVNAVGDRVAFEYDGADRIRTTTLEDGSVHSFEYSPAGWLARWHTGGATVQEFTYDAAQRLTRVQNGARVFLRAYDAKGRLASIRDEKEQVALGYRYEPSGRVAAVELPGGAAVTYEYDRAGRRVAVRGPHGNEVRLQYDVAGRRTGIEYGKALRATYSYAPNGRVTAVAWTRRDGTPVYTSRYTYDDAGRLASADYNGRVFRYDYDASGRLSEAVLPDGAREACRYDAAGNLVEAGGERFEHDALNRLTARGTTGYEYDRSGRLVARSDDRGRLLLHYLPDGTLAGAERGGAPVRYEYDPSGELLARSEGGGSAYYLNDGHELVARLAGGNVERVYLGSERLDERLGYVEGSHVRYYLLDLNNSVLAVTDEHGALLNEYLYGPFGERRLSREGVENEFGFQGRWLERETGLYHFRARWYDPASRRFIQKDPEPGQTYAPATLNPYLFAANDPVNHVDPLGGESFDPSSYIFKDTTAIYTHAPGETLEQVTSKFQKIPYKVPIAKSPIPVAQYGKMPDSFRTVGVIERRGWMYEVLHRPNPDGTFSTIIRDLGTQEAGPLNKANRIGQGMGEFGSKGWEPFPPPRPGPVPAPELPPVPRNPTSATAGEGAAIRGGGSWGKVVGKLLVIYGIYVSANNILTHPEGTVEGAKEEAGGWGGAYVGGQVGLGVGGPIGAIVGTITGAIIGALSTNKGFADWIYNNDQATQDLIARIANEGKSSPKAFEKGMEKLAKSGGLADVLQPPPGIGDGTEPIGGSPDLGGKLPETGKLTDPASLPKDLLQPPPGQADGTVQIGEPRDPVNDLKGKEAQGNTPEGAGDDERPPGKSYADRVKDKADKEGKRKDGTAGITTDERSKSSQGRDAKKKQGIVNQGDETDDAVEGQGQVFDGAQAAADAARATGIGAIAGAGLMGGLTAGIGAGLDGFFGTFGQGLGHKTSAKMGIVPKPNREKGKEPAGGGGGGSGKDKLTVPTTYSCQVTGNVRAVSNLGWSTACDFQGTGSITLSPDGSVRGTTNSGFHISFTDGGSPSCRSDPSYSQSMEGRHGGGSVSFRGTSGSAYQGSYTATSLEASGGRTGSSTALLDDKTGKPLGSTTNDVTTKLSCSASAPPTADTPAAPEKKNQPEVDWDTVVY